MTPPWLQVAGQAMTGWFINSCFSNPNHAVLEFTKNSKAKGATRTSIRMSTKGPVRFLDIVDNGRGQSLEEVEMSHHLAPSEPGNHDPYGRHGEGFKIGECQLLHPDKPSCCYRVSWFRRSNGTIEITLAVMWFGGWNEPLFCTILSVNEDFLIEYAGKDSFREIDYYQAHGITDQEEIVKVLSKFGQFTRKGGNLGTPLEDLPAVFRMVLEMKALNGNAETGTGYRIYDFHPDMFVHDGQIACKVEGRLFMETGQEDGQQRIELLSDRLAKQFLPPSQELFDPAELARRGIPAKFEMVLKINDGPEVPVDTSSHEWERVQATWNKRSRVVPLVLGGNEIGKMQFCKKVNKPDRRFKGGVQYFKGDVAVSHEFEMPRLLYTDDDLGNLDAVTELWRITWDPRGPNARPSYETWKKAYLRCLGTVQGQTASNFFQACLAEKGVNESDVSDLLTERGNHSGKSVENTVFRDIVSFHNVYALVTSDNERLLDLTREGLTKYPPVMVHILFRDGLKLALDEAFRPAQPSESEPSSLATQPNGVAGTPSSAVPAAGGHARAAAATPARAAGPPPAAGTPPTAGRASAGAMPAVPAGRGTARAAAAGAGGRAKVIPAATPATARTAAAATGGHAKAVPVTPGAPRKAAAGGQANAGRTAAAGGGVGAGPSRVTPTPRAHRAVSPPATTQNTTTSAQGSVGTAGAAKGLMGLKAAGNKRKRADPPAPAAELVDVATFKKEFLAMMTRLTKKMKTTQLDPRVQQVCNTVNGMRAT